MDVTSALNSALTGIQRGMDGLHRNSEEIAKAATGEGNIVEPLLESRVHLQQVEASAKVVKALDEATESLIDEFV